MSSRPCSQSHNTVRIFVSASLRFVSVAQLVMLSRMLFRPAVEGWFKSAGLEKKSAEIQRQPAHEGIR